MRPQDEREYLIVPYKVATGADCDGRLIVEEPAIWTISSATLAAP
jgi:hypothetical protein